MHGLPAGHKSHLKWPCKTQGVDLSGVPVLHNDCSSVCVEILHCTLYIVIPMMIPPNFKQLTIKCISNLSLETYAPYIHHISSYICLDICQGLCIVMYVKNPQKVFGRYPMC